MKILHIITDLKQGGTQKILFKLLNNKESSCRHYVVSLKGLGHYGEELKKLNIKSYSLNMNNKSTNFFKLVKLYKIFKKEQPNVVQTWMPHSDLIGGLLAKIAGIKMIIWAEVAFNLGPDVMKFTSRIIIKLNSYLSFIIPNKIIYCAKSAMSVHEEKGFDKKKSIYIPIGFKVGEKQEENDRSLSKVFTIGCIARWDPQKNHKNLLEALKILDDKKIDYQCLMASIGIDNQNIELQQVIDNVGVNKEKIKLLGYVENINDIFSKIDLNVLPSSGEAFPNIIAEAMSQEILCVGTDVGDVSEIIGEYGWTVKRKDPIALADAIREAINEFKSDLWLKKVEGAKEQIQKNYPLQQMISSYYSVWRRN